MDQQLIMGIVLIVVGLAFGLIAAAVVVNRRIDADERAERAQNDGEPEGSERAAEEEPEAAAESPDVAEPEAAPVPAETAESEADAEPESEPMDDPSPAGADPKPATPTAKAAAGEISEESLLGELHRDPRTGEIFFRRGDHEYRSADDIADREERSRLAGVVKDWSAWFREPPPQPSASGTPPPTSGMVQAIDAILQRSLLEADVSTRGVRLVQDISGGVKVLIGVKSYEVEDVPDEEIKRLIRQAVAEWEGQQ